MYNNKNLILFMDGPPVPPPPPLDLTPKDLLTEVKKRQAANKSNPSSPKSPSSNRDSIIKEALEEFGIDLDLIKNFSDIDKNIILSQMQLNKIYKAQGDEKNQLIKTLKEKILETATHYQEKIDQANKKVNPIPEQIVQEAPKIIPGGIPPAPPIGGVPPPPPIGELTANKPSAPANTTKSNGNEKSQKPTGPQIPSGFMDELKRKQESRRARSESPKKIHDDKDVVIGRSNNELNGNKTSHESRKPPVPKKPSLPQANTTSTQSTHRAAPPVPINPLAQEKAKIVSNLTKLDKILNQLEKPQNNNEVQRFIENYKEYSKNISTYLMENPNNAIENFQQTNRDLENAINSASGMLQAPKPGFVHNSSSATGSEKTIK